MTGAVRRAPIVYQVVGVGVVVAIRAVASWGAAWPQQVADESGYLAMARLMTGGPETNLGASAPYMPLYSVMVSPGFLLGLGPTGQYRVAITVNVALAGLTFLVLYRLLGCLASASSAVRAAAAAVAVSLPAVVLSAGHVWTDAATPLLLVLLLWCGVRLVDRPDTGRAVVLSTVAVAGYATHARFLPLMGVAAATLLLLGLTRRLSPIAMVGSLVLMVGGHQITGLVLAHLTDRLNMSRRSSEDLVGGVDLAGFSWGLLGQLWQAAASTAGLVVVGTLALIVTLVAGWRAAVTSPQSVPGAGRPAAPDPGPALGVTAGAGSLAFVAACLAVGFGTSVLFMVNRPRLDHLIYGRYNDMLVVPLVAIGLVVIGAGTGRPRRVMVAASLALSVALSVGGSWLLWHQRVDGSSADYVATTILGLLAFHDSPLLHLVGVGLAAAVVQAWVLCGALLLPDGTRGRLSRTAAVAGLGVLIVVGLVRADRGLDLYRHPDPSESTTIASVVPAGSTITCATEVRCPILEFYRYQHYLPDHDFALVWDDGWRGTARYLLTDADLDDVIGRALLAEGFELRWQADLTATGVWERSSTPTGLVQPSIGSD